MTGTLLPHRFTGRAEEAKALEAFETPEWCAEAILDREILTRLVVDPCCGHGTLAKAAGRRGNIVVACDIADWGFGLCGVDFLNVALPDLLRVELADKSIRRDPDQVTVLMNPPFSRAVEFVEHSLRQGVRKIVCFQRFAWWESQVRRDFWDRNPPNRIYICRDRASSWRFDIPPEARGGSSTPTAHAWFVWERGHPRGTILGHVERRAP